MTLKIKDFLFVGIQFVLFGFFMLDFEWNLDFPDWFKYINLFLAFIGLLVVLLALLQLNKNVTPFPTPKNDSVLLENGLYKWVRHPIYSGIILILIGDSLFEESIYKIGITMLLIILFHFKTEYEEAQLQNKFENYQKYKSKTGKFFPKL